MEQAIDKRTKEYRDSLKSMELVPGVINIDETPVIPGIKPDYSTRENNPGFKLCFNCGVELPPNDAGIVVSRKYPEACYECVNVNKGFMINKKGERVRIPPKVKA